MSAENWSDQVILVELPAEPGVVGELQEVGSMVREKGDCDVVVDFSQVSVLTSNSLAELVRLQTLLAQCRRKLLLCHVNEATKGIFAVTGLDELFEIVEGKFDALATVETLA
ncbi:MAG: STAS domain-containing protein [Sedimentisphaerales bacterium]|nr:STAS domain-containing protein [Sedimentisphaerales bacterium]